MPARSARVSGCHKLPLALRRTATWSGQIEPRIDAGPVSELTRNSDRSRNYVLLGRRTTPKQPKLASSPGHDGLCRRLLIGEMSIPGHSRVQGSGGRPNTCYHLWSTDMGSAYACDDGKWTLSQLTYNYSGPKLHADSSTSQRHRIRGIEFS
jgi:hypothetical protein